MKFRILYIILILTAEKFYLHTFVRRYFFLSHNQSSFRILTVPSFIRTFVYACTSKVLDRVILLVSMDIGVSEYNKVQPRCEQFFVEPFV